MENITDNGNNVCDFHENQTNEIDDGNEIINGGIEEQEQGIADNKTDTPNISLLHEDVRECVELYVHQKGYSDVTINVENGSNLGDNFMGFIGKLTINGIDRNNEKQTFNWIVKSAPNLERYRTIIDIARMFGREAYLYKDVFKIFHDFQNEKRLLEPFDEYPGFVLYYEENMHESIVMKDMKSVGYVMRPRQEPLDLNHVKLVMKAYAKFHAISYALKDQKPNVFKVIVENTKDIMVHTLLTKTVQEARRSTIMKTLSALDPERDSEVYLVLKKFLDNYGDIVLKLLSDPNDRSVIGHGDSWVNNMLWKYDATECNIPKKVCLLDWQLARYGSPACDLSYFIFTCTTKEFRDKHYDNMIQLYYYTLCDHINQLGTDPKKYLTFEVLQEELMKYSLVGLFTTLGVLSIITRDASEIPEWRADDRNPDEMEEEWSNASRNADIYNERVRGVVIDFYEKGYFNNLL